MSKVLADLLGMDRRQLDRVIKRLEHVSLQPGVDARLTAEIITGSRERIRSIGFDPVDTTARELYYGLLAYAEACDMHVRESLLITERTSSPKAIQIIAKTAESLLKKDRAVSLQPATVRKILKAVPPKKTLRLLKFRSIDSVLKREDPMVFYALATRLEDASWHAQLSARLKRLQPRDVGEASVSVLALPSTWCSKLSSKLFDNVVQPVPEIGSVLLLPSVPHTQKGTVLLTMALALQAGQRLAIEALPYRARALSAGLEKMLPDLAAGYVQTLDSVYGLQPTWQAVYQLLVEDGRQRLPDFELILGDLQWESTETRLATIHTSLDAWVGSHYLGFLTDDKPLSLHVIDITACLVLGKKYGEQVISHMRASIWNELQLRYLKHEAFEQAVITQLSVSQEVVL